MMDLISKIDSLKYKGGFMAQWFGERSLIDGVERISVPPLVFWGFVLLFITTGYFIGSFNFGIIVSKIKYKDDIRRYGSGNAGATNMLRTYGKGAAALTFILDMLKAVIVTYAAMLTGGESIGYLAGFACVIGHIYPVYYGFKGGKGVATTCAVILVLSPSAAAVCLLVFAVTVAFTRYVSLGSIFAACLIPVFVSGMYDNGVSTQIPAIPALVSVMFAVLIVRKHKANIKRIMNKTESKISFSRKKDEKTE